MGLKQGLAVGICTAMALGGTGCGSSLSKKRAREREAQTVRASKDGTIHLPAPRAEHTAIVLGDGRVWVAGGVDGAGLPTTRTFMISPERVEPGPSLLTARVGHTATLLPSGLVVVVGGFEDEAREEALASSEILDPLSASIRPGPSLLTARGEHGAAVLGEDVVVLGGRDGAGSLLSSGELVGAEQVEPLPSRLSVAQRLMSMVRLDTGDVLVTAGEADGGPAPSELLSEQDLQLSVFHVSPGRVGAAVIGRDAEVFLAGGDNQGLEAGTFSYSSVTGAFQPAFPLSGARRDAVAAAAGRIVVVVGGRDSAGVSGKVDRFQGAALGSALSEVLPELRTPRFAHTASPVDDAVLVVGGYGRGGLPLESIERVNPRWTPPPAPPAPAVVASAATQGPAATQAAAAPAPASTDPLVAALAQALAAAANPAAGAAPAVPAATAAAAVPAAAAAPAASGGSTLLSTLGPLLSGLLNGVLGGSTGTRGSTGTTTSGLGSVLGGLLNGVLGGGSGGGGGALSGILGSLLGGSGSTSGSSSTGGGLGGLLSSALGGLLGGGSSSGGSGLGGLLSSALGGLFGGGSSNTGGSSSGGLGGLLGGLLGGNSGSSSGLGSSGLNGFGFGF